MTGLVDLLKGGQWGDEGKGKEVDLMMEDDIMESVMGYCYDGVFRFNGCDNAGHTIIDGERETVLNQLPSSILHHGKKAIMGNGMLCNLPVLVEELDKICRQGVDYEGRLFISDKIHIILPYHMIWDAAMDKTTGIGTTKRGIGQAYADKDLRTGIRIGDLFDESFFREKLNSNCRLMSDLLKHVYKVDDNILNELDTEKIFTEQMTCFERIRPMVTKTEYLIQELLGKGKRLVAEGAQGALLDRDFGTYPFGTSSNTTVGGALTGSGLNPHQINRIIGVFKFYVTRVGGGPHPTELGDEAECKYLRKNTEILYHAQQFGFITKDKDLSQLVKAVSDEELKKLKERILRELLEKTDNRSRGAYLRIKGGEYGARTGRPRRCGDFDRVAASYAKMINGFTDIIWTKPDVLDEQKIIYDCVAYEYNGQEITIFPDTRILEKCIPKYSTNPGWLETISGIRDYRDLPPNLRHTIEERENALGVKSIMISNGPKREQIIYRK